MSRKLPISTLLLLAAWPCALRAAPAESVVFFLGDGMGPATVTAARIYAYGEAGRLHIEELTYTARIRTHSRNAQTTDSAPSMSAYMTGVKMNNDVLSMSAETVARIDGCTPDNGKPVSTLLELAKARGWATGVVSTARLTHATPGATYAHICHRDLENEIAAQSVPGGSAYNVALGDGVDVLLGGGRRHYLPMFASGSKRTDSRNLIQEMKQNGYQYVSDAAGLRALTGSGRILGLFTLDHMSFDLDRDDAKEPGLAEMTVKAIEVLQKKGKSYFLMVEGGRIDHALHNTNAIRALQDTVAFDDAIRAALDKVDLARTLVVVTADHDHTMIMNGYSRRTGKTVYDRASGRVQRAGVLGIVHGNLTGDSSFDADAAPYSILGFGNGENRVSGPRSSARALTDEGTSGRDYHQESSVRMAAGSETHGSGDVMLMAKGAGAEAFRGTMDNTRVFSLIRQALGL